MNSKLSSRISTLNDALFTYKVRRNTILEDIDKLEVSIDDAGERKQVYQKAMLVVEYLIEKKYDKIIELFEYTVTSALKDLFDEKYEFKFEIGKRGDSTTCEYYIHTGEYGGFVDIRMTQGRSIQEVIGTVMQIVIAKLDTEMPDVVLMDEPFGGVEPARQIIAAKFLQSIGKEFNLQLILVTQSPEFAEYADNVIDLRKV